MADLRISQLPALTGALLQATDPIAVADLSASETKKITAKDFVQSAIALIDSGSIPGDKVNVTIPAGAIGTTQLATKAVTATKLADSSTAVIAASLPASGAYIGQLAVRTPSNAVSIWNGSAWVAFQTGILTITGGTSGAVTTDVTTVGSATTVIARVQDATGPAQFLAGPSTSSGAFSRRAIVSGDLPRATTSVAGISSVPAGEGIRIDSGTSGLEARLELDNDVTASVVHHVVTYSSKGLVTGGRVLTSTDLPVATAGSAGAVAAGTEFTAAATTGLLRHTNQVTAGSGIKVSYDGQGHIVSASGLTAADVPALDASKITTGTFGSAQIADRSIAGEKLANYATTLIQEALPAGTNYFRGQFWYKESDAQLRTWSGNSWVPVGFGRLSEENLRFSGTFDASTGKVVQVTIFGSTAGLVAGQSIPPATNPLAGVYLVCATAGTYAGDAYDPGDWTLCLGQAEGFVRIDTLNGGPGAININLDDILDVSLLNPVAGDILVFDVATNTWKNKSLVKTLPSGTAAEEYLKWDNTLGAWTPSGTLVGGTY